MAARDALTACCLILLCKAATPLPRLPITARAPALASPPLLPTARTYTAAVANAAGATSRAVTTKVASSELLSEPCRSFALRSSRTLCVV